MFLSQKYASNERKYKSLTKSFHHDWILLCAFVSVVVVSIKFSVHAIDPHISHSFLFNKLCPTELEKKSWQKKWTVSAYNWRVCSQFELNDSSLVITALFFLLCVALARLLFSRSFSGSQRFVFSTNFVNAKTALNRWFVSSDNKQS